MGGESYTIDPRRRYVAVHFNNLLASRGMVALMLACLAIATGTVALEAMGYVESQISIGIGLIGIGCFSVFAWLFMYAVTYRPYLPPPADTKQLLGHKDQNVNLADVVDYSLLRLLGATYKHGEAGEVAIFFTRLTKQASVHEMLTRLEIAPQALVEGVQGLASALSWDDVASILAQHLSRVDRLHISAPDMLAALLLHPHLRSFLRQHELREQDIMFVGWWQHAKDNERNDGQRWWDPSNLLNFSGIGLSWAAGYTPFVDRFSRQPAGSLWDVGAAHEEQVQSLIGSLARRQQSNVLLVGEPGVGRIGVVKELMRKVAAGQAHPALNDQRVLYVHISQLVSLGTTPAMQFSVVSQTLDEMERAGNIIAILDGLGSIVGGGDGRVDLGDILVPFFSSSAVRVVAIMSTEDYHKRIAGNQELEHLFEIIEIPPASEEATLQLLAVSIEAWEAENAVFVPYKTLREIVSSTVSILPHIPFPEKAFDVLEELMVEAQGRGQEKLVPEDVHALIARKTGIHFGRIQADESRKLLSLADSIHRRVVNQEQGVEAVARAMVRARAGVRSHKRPIGSFLFLGPTGVGKTETAKALAEAYFGSDQYLQRLDMSEFQGEDALSRLVGSISRPVGQLPALITKHPFSVILLDEFEKATRGVQELFLPLFDEGYIADAHGRRYSFVHTILIATSNAGAELIRDEVKDDGKLPEGFDMQLREHILSQGTFLPELFNRFDGVVTFAPLTSQHVREIARLMLVDLNKRLDTKHGVTIQITDELIGYLAASGYDPQFGARPMRRLIQDTVEYWAAKQIVAGGVEPGQVLVVPLQLNTSA